MNILGLIASIFAPATKLGTAYIDGKYQVEQAKIAAEVAKWQGKATAYENDANRTHSWEMEALRQSQFSWKDEWWTVVISVILLSPMVAGAASVFLESPLYIEAMHAAWDEYRNMPIVFQLLFPFFALASIGIRHKGKTEAADAIRKLSE